MSPTTVLVLCFLCIFSSAAASAAGDGELTAYEILQRYDFPVGLLPKGVTGYDLDPATGQFSAYLNGTCSFSLEGSYQLKYRPTIRGLIAKDRITKLNGISVKVLFLWLNIVEVVRSGDELDFSVGIASANFPIDNFEECPQCGCGLNCVNGQVSKLRTNPFVASV
ncbi:uncharacterized protein LOC131155574 [Malania oleifera]|uniref:uncharacterized protein LOC131155574 n=1 Tax=Malania oleifera TaxID=397392 RepID=UPI0025ADAA7C|nr:uncharacterized protein LOC131155574 [Malania oleifera]